MSLEAESLIDQMALDEGHVGQRVHVEILVIGEDEQDIGSSSLISERLLSILSDRWADYPSSDAQQPA